MDGLTEPVDARRATLLRRAVRDHALAEPRRVFPARLHVGTPGAAQRVLALGEPTDHALRTDVVAAMLSHATRRTAPEDVLVWLTRPGELDLQDVDAHWLAASLAACAEAGRPLTMVVVNRHGWRDPRTGTARHWKRVRRR